MLSNRSLVKFLLVTISHLLVMRQVGKRHITWNSKLCFPLSQGFSEIASDDSETLLEKCVSIFKDVCEVYCLESSADEEKLQKEIIKKLQCLLSDRASVMKAFDSKMLKYIKDF